MITIHVTPPPGMRSPIRVDVFECADPARLMASVIIPEYGTQYAQKLQEDPGFGAYMRQRSNWYILTDGKTLPSPLERWMERKMWSKVLPWDEYAQDGLPPLSGHEYWFITDKEITGRLFTAKGVFDGHFYQDTDGKAYPLFRSSDTEAWVARYYKKVH